MARNNWRQEGYDQTKQAWQEAITEGQLYIIRRIDVTHAVQDGFHRRQSTVFEVPCKVVKMRDEKKTQCELVYMDRPSGKLTHIVVQFSGHLKDKDYGNKFAYQPVAHSEQENHRNYNATEVMKEVTAFKAEQDAITAQMQAETDEAANITRFDGYSKELRQLGYDQASYREKAVESKAALIEHLQSDEVYPIPLDRSDYQKYATASVVLERVIDMALDKPERETETVARELDRLLDRLLDDRDIHHDGLDRAGISLAVARLRILFSTKVY